MLFSTTLVIAVVLGALSSTTMALPTVTLDEVARGIQDATTNAPTRKVLEGLLNDFMDLQYGKETPYTTGNQVLPTGASIEDIDAAVADDTTEIQYKPVFGLISEVFKSGDLSVRSENDGTWDPRFKPVLVLVTPNKKK